MNILLVILIVGLSITAFVSLMFLVVSKVLDKDELPFVSITLFGSVAVLLTLGWFIGSSYGIQREKVRMHSNVSVVSVLKDPNTNTTEIKLLYNDQYTQNFSTNNDEIGKVFAENIGKKVDVTFVPWFYAPSKEGQSNNIVSEVKLSETNKGEK